jgi:hypothetical protein
MENRNVCIFGDEGGCDAGSINAPVATQYKLDGFLSEVIIRPWQVNIQLEP